MTGYLQAQGMAGKTVTVQVLSRPAGDGARRRNGDAGEVMLESRQVTLGGDGEVLPVKFESDARRPRPPHALRSRLPPPDDRNPADNSREADIEIVDRKNHVLLMADGPMREYQFLRNQLFRDRYTTVDVLLQSGKPGMSQEAKKMLDDFPATRKEMFDYDCVVALDPNWQALERRPGGTAGEMGGRTGRRADRRGRAGQCLPRRRRLGAGPGHDADPQSVSRRVSRPAGGHGKQHVFDQRAVAAGFHPRRARGRLPLAGRHGHRQPPGLGVVSRRVQLLSRARSQGRRPPSTPDSPTRAPPKAISSRSISPGSSTARAECSTWAAARCGGSAPSTRPTSSSSTPS